MSNCKKCQSVFKRFQQLKRKIKQHNKIGRKGKVSKLIKELHDSHKLFLDGPCADCLKNTEPMVVTPAEQPVANFLVPQEVRDGQKPDVDQMGDTGSDHGGHHGKHRMHRDDMMKGRNDDESSSSSPSSVGFGSLGQGSSGVG